MEHTFDANNICTACEWMVPGLYIDGKLQFTWDQMIANNYVSVDDKNRLNGVVKSLYGRLVVAEGVSIRDSSVFDSCSLDSVYLPPSFEYMTWGLFKNSPALEEVRCFGRMSTIDNDALFGCTSLKSFIVPEGVEEIQPYAFFQCTSLSEIVFPETLTRISEHAFEGCTALTKIDLPSSLKHISNDVFKGCTGLTSIELPEGLEYFGDNFISLTNITSLTAPSTLTGFGVLRDTSLVNMDFSKAQITTIGGETYANNPSLENIVFPATLQKLADSAFVNCVNLKRLTLPASFNNLYDEWGGDLSTCTALNTVVWPATLSDGSVFSTAPSLKNILYTGSQLQWDLTTSKDLFVDKTIITDYVPEG